MDERLVGIDIGGTFTDGVAVNADGGITVRKAPSTPGAPEDGLFDCLGRLADAADRSLQEFVASISKFTYGTTLTTNVVIQRSGVQTGLITTRGFGDTTLIARLGREYLGADLRFRRPEPIVPRDRIIEVKERVDFAGEVLTPLDEVDAREAADALVEAGCKAIAVAFLWSFRNPDHEANVAEYIRTTYPDVFVSASHEVAPVQGEYERFATAVVNAYVGPAIADHFDVVAAELDRLGLRVPPLVMGSSGGLLSFDEAARRPVLTVNSGPSGAAIASKAVGEATDRPNLVTIDMGGTSLDASLVTEGEYATELTTRAGGHTLLVPKVEVHSVGAGGGSVARIDEGRLRVGPGSAGADPGPACYGRGGTKPTVTDADLLLGLLDPDYFAGGSLHLDVEAAWERICIEVADPLGLDGREAAAAIRAITNAEMADGLRLLTVERGRDPREYNLVACGGAGPTHAAAIAAELGVGTVVVPASASVHSATGIVSTDIEYRAAATERTPLDDVERMNAALDALLDEGAAFLDAQGIDAADRSLEPVVKLRYKGQTHEVSVPVPSVPLDAAAAGGMRDRFEERYVTRYGPGSAFGGGTVEAVTFEVTARGRTRKPPDPDRELTDVIPDGAERSPREATFEGTGAVETAVYDGDRLVPGNAMSGPVILERVGTTIVVPPGAAARIDGRGNTVIDL